MTNDEILAALTPYSATLPREALIEAGTRREELTPRLLEALDQGIGWVRANKGREIDTNLPFFAFFLLAQFREPRLYPRLLEMLELNDELDNLLGGETAPELFPAVIRDTFDSSVPDSLEALKRTIENRAVCWVHHDAAVSALCFLSRDGALSREELAAYLRHLIRDVYVKMTKEEAPWDFYTALVQRVVDEQLVELKPDIKELYDHDLIEVFLDGAYKDFLRNVTDPARRREDFHMTDAVKELEQWGAFTGTAGEAGDKPRRNKAASSAGRRGRPRTPVVRQTPKIGRNDPCPCGSGKKYKHCCLNKNGATPPAGA